MIRLYLAGPMSNLPEQNYPAFHAEAARLRALGYEVVSPAELCSAKGLPWLTYMIGDIPHLLTCEVVALLPGWEKSRGAVVEHDLAVGLGLTVVLADSLVDQLQAAV